MKTARIVLLIGALAGTHALVASVAYGVGFLQCGAHMDRERTAEERELLAPILAADPAFKNVTLEKMSSGGVNLQGEVPTTADRERLEKLVAARIGEHWLEWRRSVGVKGAPPR